MSAAKIDAARGPLAAEARLGALREGLLVEGEIEPQKLQRVFDGGLPHASDLLALGEYGAAFVAAQASTDVRGARKLMAQARIEGSGMIYGARGKWTAQELANRVAQGGLAYKGDPLPRRPTRLQCHSDCVVHQIYNHPRLAPARAALRYDAFLEAVSGALKIDVRSKGVNRMQLDRVLRDLGLAGVPRRAASENELLDALDAHGALMTSIRWGSTEQDRKEEHGILVQGAFLEDGVWNFVMIDSHDARPQVVPYGELLVLGADEFQSLEPLPERELVPALRRLYSGDARVAAAARLLAEKNSSRGWRRLLAGFRR